MDSALERSEIRNVGARDRKRLSSNKWRHLWAEPAEIGVQGSTVMATSSNASTEASEVDHIFALRRENLKLTE